VGLFNLKFKKQTEEISPQQHENKPLALKLLGANFKIDLFWNTAWSQSFLDSTTLAKGSHTCTKGSSLYWEGLIDYYILNV
jgi:hypothetical protein